MPLNKYGLLIGTKTNYFRDAPDNFGKFYHGNIDVQANGTSYRCAIDVDSQVTHVQWRIIEFTAADLASIAAKGDGWHLLASNDTSGAIDYIRWRLMWVYIIIYIPILMWPRWRWRIPPWLAPFKVRPFENPAEVINIHAAGFKWLRVDQSSYWRTGSNMDAIQQLESVLTQGNKVFVFGEFFNTGNGVHDIHQNQGDPIGGGHDATNWIWQDGATIVQKADGNYVGFFNKFETQSFKTDNQGRPV